MRLWWWLGDGELVAVVTAGVVEIALCPPGCAEVDDEGNGENGGSLPSLECGRSCRHQ